MKGSVSLWLASLYVFGCALFPAPAGAEGVLFEKESMYHYVMVEESDGIRKLRFRRKGTDYDESSMDTRDPLRPVSDYVRLFFSAFLFCPDAERVLMIGLGGGCVPRMVHHYFPDVQMDSVELDPVVVEAAERYFDFKTDAKNRVFVRDGRVQVRLFLKERAKYDIVMLDAFRGGYIPYHLTTQEFMEQCKALLTDRGVVAANMRPDFKIYDYHKRTIAAVFPSLFTFGKVSNKICIGSPVKRQVSDLELQKTALELQARHPINFRFPTLLEDFIKETDYETAGEVFTDDYAPANVLRGIPRE